MRNNKLNIVHFHNGNGGGVLSVIANLLHYSENTNIVNHVIFTIDKKTTALYKAPDLTGAASVKLFYYSSQWNFYHTCRELAKLLPDENSVIVAHDWLELGMVSNLGLQNPVVQVLHGDYEYYYGLAKKHNEWIDAFITVSESMANKLSYMLTKRQKDISYLRFPVQENQCVQGKTVDFSIIFIGRCTMEKGYPILQEVKSKLAKKNVRLKWHIVGELTETTKATHPWEEDIDITFHGCLKNTELNALLCRMHFFILPSMAEGMPVTLIEAMKAGVIPLVNDLPGGIQEIVINGETGFKIKSNEPGKYVGQIISLIQEEELRISIQQQIKQSANRLFDPIQNTSNYEKVFSSVRSSQKKRVSQKVYGSRLDIPWLHNSITSFIRWPKNR